MRRLAGVWLVLLVVGMNASGMICWAGESAKAPGPVGKSQWERPFLQYIPPDVTAVLVVQPQRVLTAPEWKLLPAELVSAIGKQDFGFDPAQIQTALVVIDLKLERFDQETLIGFLAWFAKPIDPEKVLPEFKEMAVKEQKDNMPYYRTEGPEPAALCMPDPQTLLLGRDELIRKMLAAPAMAKEKKLASMVAEMDSLADVVLMVDFEPISAALETTRLPWDAEFLRRLAPLVLHGQMEINLTKQLEIRLALQSPTEAAAKELEGQLKALLQMVKEELVHEMLWPDRGGKKDPVDQTFVQYMDRAWEELWKLLQVQRAEKRLSLHLVKPWHDLERAAIAVPLAAWLPELHQSYQRTRYAASMNHLHQLGLAMLNYEQTYGRFPTNIEKDGKPLLSWRVQILPYLEQEALYRQFRLDEPWDSPHNRKLIERMPAVFQSPGVKTKPGMTVYLGLVGEGTVFEEGKKRTFADITDGASNTIMLVEADPDRAVPWTKPEDLPFDPKKPLNGLGHARRGGFLVLFCDGSVRFISEKIAPEVFRCLALIADGEPVDWNKIEP